MQYAANWNESGKDVSEKYINLVRELHRYMTPFVSKKPREAFFNYKDLDLGINNVYGDDKKGNFVSRDYGIKYFKENFSRLVQIKRKVDPGNFFRNEQSISALQSPKS